MRLLTKLLIAPATAALTLGAILLTPDAGADTKPFSFTNFETIKVTALMTVVVKQGPYSVTVNEPKGDFSNLKIEQKGKDLFITRQDSTFDDRKKPAPDYVVTVTAPSLSAIDVAAASEVEGSNLSFKDLKLNISSGSSATLSGSCNSLSANISSGAKFDGRDLKCKDASVNASTGASASAFAQASAMGNASTGGAITFHGNPKSLDRHVSLGGSVRAL
ncbi:MAG TPA: DUF2807 domain-containing protein [Hyphomonadaceae bacterium]|nr:DUF2807 domain-containing protein [Hyphomonadaceae bacterium]